MAYIVDESYVPLGGSVGIDGNTQDVEWVLVSDIPMTQYEVLSISELPLLRSQHPEDKRAYLINIDAHPRDGVDPFKWTLTLTYATQSSQLLWPSRRNDPTKWPAQITIGTYTYQEVVRKAFKENGKDYPNPSIDVENSAGDEFMPAYEQPMTGETITIVRNERDFDGDTKKLFRNSINRTKVRIAGRLLQPYEGWMRAISGTRQVDDQGRFYWAVTYEIAVKDWDKGWRVELLDAGFYYKVVSGLDVNRIRIKEWMVDKSKSKTSDDGKRDVTSPAKLNGAGGLATSTLVDGQRVIQSTYRTFQTYHPIDWSPMKLPEQETDHNYAG